MSKKLIEEFHQKQAMLRKLQEDLERMESNPELEAEVLFREELQELLGRYNKTSEDALMTLSPFRGGEQVVRPGLEPGRKRKKRILKVYKHPETGEIIKTRGGNHKLLKEWKAEHGGQEVEDWLVETQE